MRRFVLPFVCLAAAGFGQTGSISGTILTTDGGPVQDAVVAAKNEASSAAFSTKSTPAGDYSLTGLPAGRYELTVALPPLFMTFKQAHLAVQAGQTARVKVELHDVNLDTLGDGASGYAFISADHPAPSGPVPRTHEGKPDFTGIWLPRIPTPAGVAPELLPAAAAIVKQRQENFGRDFPNSRCLPLGPSFTGFFADFEIVQTPSRLIILEENGDPARTIYMDTRSHPKDVNPSFMGHSIGRWEGDTLVVDTLGFNDRGWLTFAFYPQTEKLRITERFRRLDLGHLEVQTTFEDPDTFVKPWTNKRVHALGPKEMERLEYVCTENNKDVSHIVGK
ncbi:MAG: carboxypeptidase regulatory-like domain-containing protein [Bryobacterales bacterium]|nr:carboxypeptidase regulatory-like domain-containing protein [Bryobacterales bacterium]MBV9401930.1 carboxypeptidase regulatory-like domain-containing protein [Bryobacterales bacterium]